VDHLVLDEEDTKILFCEYLGRNRVGAAELAWLLPNDSIGIPDKSLAAIEKRHAGG
jgi:hypothetical protein